MSAEIVNLRRARKAKERSAREEQAQVNRVAHGLTRLERTTARATKDADTRRLDGHKLERADES